MAIQSIRVRWDKKRRVRDRIIIRHLDAETIYPTIFCRGSNAEIALALQQLLARHGNTDVVIEPDEGEPRRMPYPED